MLKQNSGKKSELWDAKLEFLGESQNSEMLKVEFSVKSQKCGMQKQIYG